MTCVHFGQEEKYGWQRCGNITGMQILTDDQIMAKERAFRRVIAGKPHLLVGLLLDNARMAVYSNRTRFE
ncbi:MAG: hypothetical protein NTY64_04165 [Deltaproteobacteria bacterium]|nr:hypothetical protein [Deltaproteobacteria bacterium]